MNGARRHNRLPPGDKFAEALLEVILIRCLRTLTLHGLINRIKTSMAYADTLPQQRRFAETTRPDAWWVQPLFVFLGFSAFIVYSTWAALQGNHYWFNGNGADYLSPFYSPEIFGSYDPLFGSAPPWWPGWLPAFSAPFLI